MAIRELPLSFDPRLCSFFSCFLCYNIGIDSNRRKPKGGIATPLTVKASEARAQFPTIAKRGYEDNIEVTVIKGSKPYVKIVPIDDNASDGENGTMYLDAYLEAADEYRDLFEALSK